MRRGDSGGGRLARRGASFWVPLLVAAVAAACSGAPELTPTPSPEPTAAASPGPGETASPIPTPTPQRDLASFEPDEAWRTVLQLASGPGGLAQGRFRAGGRYRIQYDCVGDGSIRIRVAGEVQAQRDCASGELDPPTVVRGANGRLRANVVAAGRVEFIVTIEVPRG